MRSVIAAIIDFKPRTIHVNCSSRIRFCNWRLPSEARAGQGDWQGVATASGREGEGVGGRAQGVGICTLAIRLRPRVDSTRIASRIDCNLQGRRGREAGRQGGRGQGMQLVHCSVGRAV